MAKDPAFLFYPNDFDSATKFFSNDQVGVYMRLLIAQFQHGRLTEKQYLHIAGGWDSDIMQKFTRDKEGKLYNERLELEINKRKKFTESRRKNINKRYTSVTSEATYEGTKPLHMENENENENRNKPKTNVSGFFAGSEHLSMSLTEVQMGSAIQYLSIARQIKADAGLIQNLWQIFKIKEFNSKKWYNNEHAVFTHFMNNLRYEKIETKSIDKPRDDSKAKSILGI